MTISIELPREAQPVRTVDPVEVGRLSHSLAQAFYDDPVFGWFWPYEHRRYERITRFHLSQMAYIATKLDAMPEGEGTVLDNTLVQWTQESAMSRFWSTPSLPKAR